MARHGIINEYWSTQEHWLAYTERMQWYFPTNNVKSTKKQRAIFLSSDVSANQEFTGTKQASREIDKLVQLVQEHHQPPPSESVQWYTFNTHSRKQRESLALYVVELRRLAEYSN